MKKYLGFLSILLTVAFARPSHAENPIHIYLSASGNARAGGAETMRVKGLCYQVNASTLWINKFESRTDKAYQDGGTVFFDMTVHQGFDQIEFQVQPGSQFTCRGHTIQSDGTYNSFNLTRKNVKLGSIKEDIVFEGPSYYKTTLSIVGQKN